MKKKNAVNSFSKLNANLTKKHIIDSVELYYKFCKIAEAHENEIPLLDSIAEIIINAPIIDAVEVVRCQDCKHFGTDGCAMDKYTFDVVEEGFCSYGEKR